MSDLDSDCPLCSEPMKPDDLAFYPCECKYQICRFCWTKLKYEDNGLCPNCRKPYGDEPVIIDKSLLQNGSEVARNKKKRREQPKHKMSPEYAKLLPELRVVQSNLIFVIGLPGWVNKDKEIMKGPEYFGKYGEVYKIEINQNPQFATAQGQPSLSAYVTYKKPDDAMRAIIELERNNPFGRSLRVSLGTTKYCSQFLKNLKCTKHECMYLHEIGEEAASFTKEQMQAGKHTEYMSKLLCDFLDSQPNLKAANAQCRLQGDNPLLTVSMRQHSVPINLKLNGDYTPQKDIRRYDQQQSISKSTTPNSSVYPPAPWSMSSCLKAPGDTVHHHEEDITMCNKQQLKFRKANAINQIDHSRVVQRPSSQTNTDDSLHPNSNGSSSSAMYHENSHSMVDSKNCAMYSSILSEHQSSSTSPPLHQFETFSNFIQQSSRILHYESEALQNSICYTRSSNPGFRKSRLSEDEDPDIDFDPLLVSQEALAEMMAQESQRNINVSKQLASDLETSCSMNRTPPRMLDERCNAVDDRSTWHHKYFDSVNSNSNNSANLVRENEPQIKSYSADNGVAPPPGFEVSRDSFRSRVDESFIDSRLPPGLSVSPNSEVMKKAVKAAYVAFRKTLEQETAALRSTMQLENDSKSNCLSSLPSNSATQMGNTNSFDIHWLLPKLALLNGAELDSPNASTARNLYSWKQNFQLPNIHDNFSQMDDDDPAIVSSFCSGNIWQDPTPNSKPSISLNKPLPIGVTHQISRQHPNRSQQHPTSSEAS